MVLMLTDGFPEATAGDGEQIGYVRLRQLVERTGTLTVENALEPLFDAVRQAENAPLDDDCTALLLERTP